MRIGKNRGFTLIELIVVMAIVAMLAGLAAPMVYNSMITAKESALKHNLMTMRKAIDDYYSDNIEYPERLDDLMDKRYLRSIPEDPFTERADTWRLIFDESIEGSGGIIDVRSGSELVSNEGEAYRNW